MRTISKSRDHFHGTHKGYEIEIEREKDRELRDAGRRFYIRVWNDYGHAYDGWSKEHVVTLADAKREALYGASLKPRPTPESPPPSDAARNARTETGGNEGPAVALLKSLQVREGGPRA